MDQELNSVLTRVLDPDWLSEHLGQPVRASRLRVKPNTSLGLALEGRDDARPVGWLRVLWPINHSKADTARRDADQHGHRVTVRRLGERLLTVTGPLEADPKLRHNLRRAVDHALLTRWSAEDLLRYNPMRRLVVRDGDKVVRIAAAASEGQDEIQNLIAARVPCPERLDDGRVPGCSVLRFTGDGDLVALPTRVGAQAAGRLIADLHAGPVLEPRLLALLAGRSLDPIRQGERHAELLDRLSPELATRTRETLARLNPWSTGEQVLSHGDLSPDQVLTSDQGRRVWLTDLDRAQLAPGSADLGSFLAEATPELGEAFLAGYVTAGGRAPGREELSHAVAWSLMLRLMDPLRHAAQDWQDRVRSGLLRIEEVLA